MSEVNERVIVSVDDIPESMIDEMTNGKGDEEDEQQPVG